MVERVACFASCVMGVRNDIGQDPYDFNCIVWSAMGLDLQLHRLMNLLKSSIIYRGAPA